MNEKPFDFNKLIADSKDTLLNPKGYFESMSTTGGMVEPVLKALIYGLVTAIFNFIWFYALGNVVSFGFFGGAFGVMAFIGTIIGALIGLFIGAVIVLLISSICDGNTDFEANLRVSASLMVLMPIQAFLGFLGAIGGFVIALISIAVGAYGLYLLYLALTKTLKTKEGTTRIVIYVLLALFLIFQIVGFFSRRALRHMGREMSRYEQIYGKEGNNESDYNYYDTKAKPEKFPSKALEQVREHLSTGGNVITKEKIDRLVKFTNEMSENEEDNDKMLALIADYGYSDLSEYTNDYLVVVSGVTAVASLNAMEELMNASGSEKKAAEGFKMDEMLKSAAIQSILSAKLTEADLVTVYKNWDSLKELESKASRE